MAKSVSTGFPVVVGDIQLHAYKEMYEAGVLPRLIKEVGNGEHGSLIQYTYFDPTTIATAASTAAEANDFSTTTALTNSSKTIAASEFVTRSDLTDTSKEGATEDLAGETGRQLGISMAYKVDAHIWARMTAGFTYAASGSVMGTNATNGFTFGKYAAAKSQIAARALTVPTPINAVVPEYSWFWTNQSLYSSTYAGTVGAVGDKAVSQYYVGRILGNIDVTTIGLAIVTATSLGLGFMFAKDAVAYWNPRPIRVEKQRDASSRADEYVASVRGGATVLIPNYGIRLRMYSKAPT